MFEITVLKVFSAAHALRLADGAMEPLHGHDWQVEVTVSADQLDQIETVMDFHVLESQLSQLTDRFHNRCLNDVEPFREALNPTAERVAQWIGQSVMEFLPDHVRLVSSSVTEAPGCKAIFKP